MRIAIALSFLLAAAPAARGSDVSRYQVERGSELEKELGYEVSVQDKHDEWQSDSRDGIGIEGPALKVERPIANRATFQRGEQRLLPLGVLEEDGLGLPVHAGQRLEGGPAYPGLGVAHEGYHAVAQRDRPAGRD